jgi:hypothetical protein
MPRVPRHLSIIPFDLEAAIRKNGRHPLHDKVLRHRSPCDDYGSGRTEEAPEPANAKQPITGRQDGQHTVAGDANAEEESHLEEC